MSKKKHPEHVNHERWLVSYADFITLLFAFFVVLFASGQSNKRKQLALAHSMQAAFDHDGIFDPHSKTPPISDDPNAIVSSVPLPLALPLPSLTRPQAAARSTADRIREAVRKEVKERKLSAGAISVHSSADGLVISLHEAGFFATGSAEIEPAALAALRSIAMTLPNQAMRVEGHTDNIPIQTAQYASNWELSTARAAAITRMLLSERVAAPEQISAAGYAEFRPVADNSTAEGRLRNRRVDIVLLDPPEPPPTP